MTRTVTSQTVWSTRSNRASRRSSVTFMRSNTWITTIPSSMPTASMMPNHTTGSNDTNVGKVKLVSRCACQSRSNPSLEAPAAAAMPRNISSTGLARTWRMLEPATRVIAPSGSRTAFGERWNPVSGMTSARTSPEHDGQPAAEHDRQAEVDRRQADAHAEPDESGHAADLRAAQKQRPDALLADLVRDPRLRGPAQERLADAANHLREHDRAE